MLCRFKFFSVTKQLFVTCNQLECCGHDIEWDHRVVTADRERQLRQSKIFLHLFISWAIRQEKHNKRKNAENRIWYSDYPYSSHTALALLNTFSLCFSGYFPSFSHHDLVAQPQKSMRKSVFKVLPNIHTSISNIMHH